MPASATKQKGNVPPLPLEVDHVLHLDNSGIESAKSDLQDGAVTPSYGPYRDSIVELLNAALATEWFACCATSATTSPQRVWHRRALPRSSSPTPTRSPRTVIGSPSASCNWAANPISRPMG